MFYKSYEERLFLWKSFRDGLEVSENPIEECINFWETAPEVRYQADPYDIKTWPTPWEIIKENNFCPFVKILAICYTLQLTERFSGSVFEIHITQTKNQIKYILAIDGKCVNNDQINFKEFTKNLKIEKSYTMPCL